MSFFLKWIRQKTNIHTSSAGILGQNFLYIWLKKTDWDRDWQTDSHPPLFSVSSQYFYFFKLAVVLQWVHSPLVIVVGLFPSTVALSLCILPLSIPSFPKPASLIWRGEDKYLGNAASLIGKEEQEDRARVKKKNCTVMEPGIQMRTRIPGTESEERWEENKTRKKKKTSR